jgi:hypothetical protein
MPWVKANPGKSALMGKTPADPAKLISKDDYKKHVLALDAFVTKAAEATSYLVDVRDPSQRKQIPEWAKKAPNFALDKFMKNLSNPQFKATVGTKTLCIFDAVGKQVQWLQYVLEDQGYTNYVFLEKGALSVFPE